MYFKLFLISSLVIFSTVFVSPDRIIAQSDSSISVDIVPPNPAPFEDISITLSSYANDLDSVLITWFVGGKNVSSGIGKKSFFAKASSSGSETLVTASVSLPSGLIEKRIIIRPNVMVLLWQASDSYVPPFYRGKAMLSPGSKVKVVAMPEIKGSGGGLILPTNMTYAWEKDYTNDQEASGYGKNSFTYESDYLDNLNNISVTVSTVDGQNLSEANMNIGTTQPEIVFYKSDNNLGTLWEQALFDGHKIQGDEIVVATPYFISPKEIQNPMLIWSWFINGNPIDVSGFKKNVIPIRAPEGTPGTSTLRLDLENKYKIWESASKEINIEF